MKISKDVLGFRVFCMVCAKKEIAGETMVKVINNSMVFFECLTCGSIEIIVDLEKNKCSDE